MQYHILLLLLLLSSSAMSGYGTGAGDADDNPKHRKLEAVRLTQNISIDGRLLATEWTTNKKTGRFTQIDPNPGQPASQETQVYLAYDNDAIYVSARLHDTEADKILKELSPRDQGANADRFTFMLDTYQTGQNGYGFQVSAAGVQMDYSITGNRNDRSWNAIWDSAVSIDEEGWSVEMRIPYAAIRFPESDVQTWNVQFAREIRRTRERSYWNEVDPQVRGVLNQSGVVNGIEEVRSPVRLNITPYIVGALQEAQGEAGSDWLGSYSAGMDLQVGLGDAYTLDMMLVPDFGQTPTDNRILNLSPFEQRFDEQRPFFNEGTELFEKGGLFYTRRIGGSPINRGAADDHLAEGEELVSNPTQTRLYNASKLTGRNNNGLATGVFNAIARPTYATIRSSETGEERSVQTSTLTNYNVLAVDQAMKNNSSWSMVNTNVWRSGEDRDANVTGGFFDIKDKKQTYNIEGSAMLSQVIEDGSTDLGYSYNVDFSKISGKVTYNLGYAEESDNYNINDLGFIRSPNERSVRAGLNYNQFEPKGGLNNYRLWTRVNYNRLHTPDVFTDMGLSLGFDLQTKSRWSFGASNYFRPTQAHDYFEPRTSDFSQYFAKDKLFSLSQYVSSDYRNTIAFDVRTRYYKADRENQYGYSLSVSPRVRLSDQLAIRYQVNYQLNNSNIGYVNKENADYAGAGVADDAILFGIRDRTVVENSLSGKYVFSSTMALNFSARHYWDRVAYNDFGILDESGQVQVESIDETRIDSQESGYDQNFNALNIDVNYTWRFAPGSDIIFVYKSDIATSDNDPMRSWSQNWSEVFNSAQNRSVSLKLIYYLDYNTLMSS